MQLPEKHKVNFDVSSEGPSSRSWLVPLVFSLTMQSFPIIGTYIRTDRAKIEYVFKFGAT